MRDKTLLLILALAVIAAYVALTIAGFPDAAFGLLAVTAFLAFFGVIVP